MTIVMSSCSPLRSRLRSSRPVWAMTRRLTGAAPGAAEKLMTAHLWCS